MRTLDARGLDPRTIAAKLAPARSPIEAALPAAREILDDVRRRGDAAVVDATERLDGVRPPALVLPRAELDQALDRIPEDLRSALDAAARRIAAFHRMQLPVGFEIPAGPGGSSVGEQPRALDRVGAYVPGGARGYPSSALMGTIPARVAGVSEILVASPPRRETGRPSDAVLAAAALGGADELLVAGGAQAIAAMALGTESVRPVDKIVGPGNAYVTAAKLLVADRVGTDGIAGPSEVLVLADDALESDVLAAELLAQAEHDPDAVAIALVLDGRDLVDLAGRIEARARALPRGREALEALRRNGWIVRAASVAAAVEIANAVGPEHLVLGVREARALLYAVRNAGAVFLGPWTAAAHGDYGLGPNHVLPTAGSARWRGGLSARDFLKFVAFAEVSPPDAAALAVVSERLAREEGFEAHAAAARARVPEARG